jgi:death-on-curing family protein
VNYLYPKQVLYLYQQVIQRSGGTIGLRDEGLLESAVYRPQASFGGRDLYPDLWSKAAALGHSIILNHPFVDGNKRVGFEAMRLMLRLNGYDLYAAEEAKFPLGAWEYHSSMKLIETSEKKPLRIFTHVSENDLRAKDREETYHNWVMAGQRTADALKAKGYNHRFVFSVGFLKPHLNHFILCGGDIFTHIIRAHRQLPVAAVN